MSKTTIRGGALLAPLPAVLVSCRGKTDENSEAVDNIITIAWTGIVNTVPPKTYIAVRRSRFSYNIIKNSGEFVINLPTANMAKKLDYCGIYTGKKVDKFEKCSFTKESATVVSSPMISECPVCLECKVTRCEELGSHDLFIADIVATNVDEELFDASGKIRIDKAGLMTFAHGEYFELGRKIGYFGFSAKKKHSSQKKRTPKSKKN